MIKNQIDCSFSGFPIKMINYVLYHICWQGQSRKIIFLSQKNTKIWNVTNLLSWAMEG